MENLIYVLHPEISLRSKPYLFYFTFVYSCTLSRLQSEPSGDRYYSPLLYIGLRHLQVQVLDKSILFALVDPL